jgi:anti-sigma B factor antagonist
MAKRSSLREAGKPTSWAPGRVAGPLAVGEEPVEPAEGLEIGVQLTSDTTVMWVRGEVDMLTVPQLSPELSARLRDGADVLVLDLRDVTFLSAGGLSVLLAAAEQAHESGITLYTLPSRAVRQIATLLGLAGGLNFVGEG